MDRKFFMCISFGILLGSIRTNLIFIIQCFATFVFFLLRAIGERCGSLGTKRNAAGIFQAIAGFFSLLICFSQLLNNETFNRPIFPTYPMSPYNEMDIMNVLPSVAAPPQISVV